MERLKPFILILLLWSTSLLSIQHLPLEKHEVLVLATAQNMILRQDYVLPWYLEQPRLNKPPLNYWLTAGLAQLNGGRVQIWHGRLISLLASLGAALLIFYWGRRLYDQNIGLWAALALLAMNGWQLYAHNARPDMLYAVLCLAQFSAWLQFERSGRSLWVYIGWLAFGLAVLSKGPQAPLVLTLIWLALSPKRWQLRPLSGLLIVSAISLPWWLLLQQRLTTLGIELQQHQLSGSLLLNLASWSELFSGYYIWHGLGLMLPISLLIFQRPLAHWDQKRLFWLCFGFILIFSLGGHYRKHYLLPILPWLGLLLIIHYHQLSTRTYRLWAALALIWSLILIAYSQIWAWLMAASSLLIARQFKLPAFGALLFALGLNLNLSYALLPWNHERAQEQILAQRIATQIPAEKKLYLWQVHLPAIAFYHPYSQKITTPPQQGLLLVSNQKLDQIHAYRLLWRQDELALVEITPIHDSRN